MMNSFLLPGLPDKICLICRIYTTLAKIKHLNLVEEIVNNKNSMTVYRVCFSTHVYSKKWVPQKKGGKMPTLSIYMFPMTLIGDNF